MASIKGSEIGFVCRSKININLQRVEASLTCDRIIIWLNLYLLLSKLVILFKIVVYVKSVVFKVTSADPLKLLSHIRIIEFYLLFILLIQNHEMT